MLEVRSFCLYRHRTEPQCFVPDPSFFPPYHQRLPNMPSKFATRTAWASRGASFSATRPRFPTRREIAIFTPIHAISPRISQILSVFGDNLVVIRRVIGVENAIQHQRFNRCQ